VAGGAVVHEGATIEEGMVMEGAEVADGVIIAPGSYHFSRYRLETEFAARRRISGQLTWRFGGFYSGTLHQLEAEAAWKPSPQVSLELDAEHDIGRLPEGNFVARILSSRVNYAASPFLSFSNLIQYDNRSRNLGWQSRVRWTLQPGNDLFLVFSQGWIQDTTGGYRFSAEDSKLSAKFQYAFRF